MMSVGVDENSSYEVDGVRLEIAGLNHLGSAKAPHTCSSMFIKSLNIHLNRFCLFKMHSWVL
jgi:hypothetical protein